MDRRKGEAGRRGIALPEASDAFVDAMLSGGARIRRYERRRALVRGLSLAAAIFAAFALGLGALLRMLGDPRPDDVVAAAPPRGVVTDAEPTPGPDEEVTAFSPGEWVSVVDDNGARSFGGWIGFFAQPREDSSRVDVAAGTLVRYGADAEDGFARVTFAGTEGYVRASNLIKGESVPMYARSDAVPVRALPDGDGPLLRTLSRNERVLCAGIEENGTRWARIAVGEAEGFVEAESLGFFREGCRLDFATLYITDASGKAFFQHEAGEVDMLELQRLLEDLRPVDIDEAEGERFAAMLRLSVSDTNDLLEEQRDSERYFTLSVKGGVILIAENGAAYALPDHHWVAFWTLFNAAGKRR